MEVVVRHSYARTYSYLTTLKRKVLRVDGAPFFIDEDQELCIKSLLAAIELLQFQHRERQEGQPTFVSQAAMSRVLDMFAGNSGGGNSSFTEDLMAQFRSL